MQCWIRIDCVATFLLFLTHNELVDDTRTTVAMVARQKRVNACARKFVSRRHSFRHYFHTQLVLSHNYDIVLVTAEHFRYPACVQSKPPVLR